MKLNLKKKSQILKLLFLGGVIGYFGYWCFVDAFINHPYPLSRFYISNYVEAGKIVDRSQSVVQYMSDCKRFIINFKELYDQNYKSDTPNFCRPFINPLDRATKFGNKELNKRFSNFKPWIDPWGRPYQIRFNFEKAKLQVRSQGRYIWTELDDIVSEAPFLGKDYPKNGFRFYVEMIEYCKTASKDDMSCIFNRGWH